MLPTAWARRPSLVVFGVAFVVALVVVFFLWRIQGLVDNRPDPYSFSVIGKSIAEGRGFEGFGVVLNRRAPLYPIFIGALYWLFGESTVVVQLAQALLFAGTCTLAASLGRQLFGDRPGLIAGLMCAVHPSLLRYVPDFMLETLFAFMVTLTVWCSARFAERPTLGRALVFGVSAGLACLTKAVVLLYPLVFVGLFVFFRMLRGTLLREAIRAALRRPATLVALGAIFLGMGLAISPWTIRNYQATGGRFVLIGTGAGDAFLRGYVFSKFEYATLQKPPYEGAENEVNEMFTKLCAEQGTVWTKDDLETERILSNAAKQRLRADPLDFVRKSFVGLFTFWYEMTSLKTSLVAGLLALGSWVLAGIGLPRAHREKRPYWIVLAPIVFLNVQLAMLLSLGRYSIPVLPCLTVLAAFGVDTLLRRREGSRASAAP